MQSNPEYKQFQALIQHAQQLQQFSIPFAYITKAYAAQKLHNLYKTTKAQELMQQLQQLIAELESIKKSNPQVNNKEETKKQYTEFVLKFFFDVDTRERDGEVSTELMQMFGKLQKCIEVLQYFEPLTQDLLEKQKYAKFKMIDQHKKIKDPSLIKPKPKDPLEEELEQIAKQQEQLLKNQQQPQNLPPPQKEVKPPQPQVPTTQQLQQPSQLTDQQPPQQQQQHQPSQYQKPLPQQSQHQPPPQQFQQPPPKQPQYQPSPPQQHQQPPPPVQPQPPPIQPQAPPVQPQQPAQYQPPQQQNIQPQNDQHPKQPKLTPIEQASAKNQIKLLLQQSQSEVDFKKYQHAKEQLTKALELLQKIIDSQ